MNFFGVRAFSSFLPAARVFYASCMVLFTCKELFMCPASSKARTPAPSLFYPLVRACRSFFFAPGSSPLAPYTIFLGGPIASSPSSSSPLPFFPSISFPVSLCHDGASLLFLPPLPPLLESPSGSKDHPHPTSTRMNLYFPSTSSHLPLFSTSVEYIATSY